MTAGCPNCEAVTKDWGRTCSYCEQVGCEHCIGKCSQCGREVCLDAQEYCALLRVDSGHYCLHCAAQCIAECAEAAGVELPQFSKGGRP